MPNPIPMVKAGVEAAKGAVKLMPALEKLVLILLGADLASKLGNKALGDPETERLKLQLEGQDKIAEADRTAKRELDTAIVERDLSGAAKKKLEDAESVHREAVMGPKMAAVQAAQESGDIRQAAFSGMSSVPSIPVFPRAEPYDPNSSFNFGDLIGLDL